MLDFCYQILLYYTAAHMLERIVIDLYVEIFASSEVIIKLNMYIRQRNTYHYWTSQ